MTFSEILNGLQSTWTDQPRKVIFIAARYYHGTESLEQLRDRAKPRISGRHSEEYQPDLTDEQVQLIINRR